MEPATGVLCLLFIDLHTNHVYHLVSCYSSGDPFCVWSPGMTPNRTHHLTHPGFAEGHLPSIPSDTCLGVPSAENGTLHYTFLLYTFPKLLIGAS